MGSTVQDLLEGVVITELLDEYFENIHDEAEFYVMNTYISEWAECPRGGNKFNRYDLRLHIKHQATPWEYLIVYHENKEGEPDATRPFIFGQELIREANSPQASGGITVDGL